MILSNYKLCIRIQLPKNCNHRLCYNNHRKENINNEDIVYIYYVNIALPILYDRNYQQSIDNNLLPSHLHMKQKYDTTIITTCQSKIFKHYD